MAKLLEVIRDIGETNTAGDCEVTFGKLFDAYADISDSLVGILLRARKRKLLRYDADMLFQGVSDHGAAAPVRRAPRRSWIPNE